MKRALASTLRNLLLAFAGGGLLALAAWGQTASLVRDINASVSAQSFSPPEAFFAVGDKLFFYATLPGSGRELWVSDGTQSGTRMLGDLCLGACDGSIGILGSTGGVLLFTAHVSDSTGLWRSDGTRQGTFELRNPGELPVDPFSEAVPVAGALIFSGCTDLCSLWRSDGTTEGTRRLREEPNAELVGAGGKAYFTTSIDGHSDLWVSDGTDTGTRKVNGLPTAFFPRDLTAAGDRLFFLAYDGRSQQQLWTSDGTDAGTRVLKSFPEVAFQHTDGLRAIGDHVYFVTDNGDGTAIWRSDGTAETTRLVAAFGFRTPFNGDTILSQMEEVGSRLLFVSFDGSAPPSLLTTSGNPASVAPLACTGGCPELTLDPQVGRVTLVKTGDRILFGGSDDTHGRELWSSDGTAAGTALLRDVCPGSCDGLAMDPVPFSGKSFFMGRPTPQGIFELWTSDGTAAGTRRFADPVGGFQPVLGTRLQIAALGPTLFFPGFNQYGAELWASDGTPGGTRMVSDLRHDASSSDPGEPVVLADRLVFTACDGTHRDVWATSGAPETTTPASAGSVPCFSLFPPERLTVAGPWVYYWLFKERLTLWRTDGTASGTLPLADFDTQVSELASLGGRLFFARSTGDSAHWEMWQSDGTSAGTRKAFDLPSEVGEPAGLTALGSEMYFIGRRGYQQESAWRTDGTLAGTRRLTDDLTFDTGPVFTRVGPDVFFYSSDASSAQFWKTDGTRAGTVRVGPAFFGFLDSLHDFTAFHGALYFVLENPWNTELPPTHSSSLWRSDGTDSGTVMIKTFSETSTSSLVGLTLFNDRLYFAADDGVHGSELWASDGTAAGTTLVRDINPGPVASQINSLTAAGDRLFFSAGDADHGIEPWVSDGTAAGTRLLQDLAPFGASSYPEQFTVAGGRLYFTADDRLHGNELWSLPLASSGGCQPSPTSLCLNGGRFKVEADWRDFQGNIGTGQAVALTADTGYFWFFGPENVEVVLKVLDGRTLNDHFWVFFGGLSNVEYTLTVTDTTTGATHRYFNPTGSFGSVGDTHGFGPLGAFFSADQSAANPAKTLLPLIAERTDPAAATGTCVPNAARLCLNDGRFAVVASWKDFGGLTGSGTAVPISADTGYFWFFTPDNVEVALKVLDGQSVNGHFWIFYGALSNVEYTLTVTDTLTGSVRTYRNPSGEFASIGDVEAF